MRVYLSHSIRGLKGNKATNTDMKACCDAAAKMGKLISAMLPSLELYVPGEHEFPPVGYLLKKGYITVDQILDVDCQIISESEAMIVYVPTGDQLQGGRKVEYDHAIRTNTPVRVFNELQISEVIDWLAHLIMRA